MSSVISSTQGSSPSDSSGGRGENDSSMIVGSSFSDFVLLYTKIRGKKAFGTKRSNKDLKETKNEK